MSYKMLILATACVLVAGPILAQESESVNYRQDATVGVAGSFVKATTNNGVQETATHTANILGTYRYYFTKNIGLEVNYGWNRGTQDYRSSANSFGIPSNVHEVTTAAVYRIPFKKCSLFVLGGAGALIFDPRDTKTFGAALRGADYQARATGVYGGGADFNITQRIFLRTEYRGLVYQSPTYGVEALHGMDRLTHRAEPSFGVGYRF